MKNPCSAAWKNSWRHRIGQFEFVYNIWGELRDIYDPLGRAWALRYGNPPDEENWGLLTEIEDPMGFTIGLAYSDDLWKITDKNGNAYEFSYVGGHLTRVTDPAPFNNQQQSFSYDVDVTPGIQETTYTDRRWQVWVFTYDMNTGNLLSVTDPLMHTQTWAYDETDPALVHERTGYTTALNKTWEYDYDLSGNVLSITDPLQHRWSYTYDSLNNLKTGTPPGAAPLSGNPDKMVTYDYDDPDHPTSVTEIEEPPAVVGGPVPTTTVEYYGPTDGTPFGTGAWNGLIERITPPFDAALGNPVVTEFEYDARGHLRKESEGPPGGGRAAPVPVVTEIINDGVGRVTRINVGDGRAASCGEPEYDGNDNVTGVLCCIWDSGEDRGGPSSWPPIAACPTPAISLPLQGVFTADPYTGMGEPTRFVTQIGDGTPGWSENSIREVTFDFDELGRLTGRGISTTEAAWDQTPAAAFERDFTLDPDWVAGTSDRTGPDGQQTHTVTDVARRVTSTTRGSITATATYYDDDSLDTITYGNGTRTKYSYYDDGGVSAIRHETTAGVRIHELAYAWTADGLVASIMETDDHDDVSTTTFTYDNRNRLNSEARAGQHPYYLIYLYDIAGNRTQKVDILNSGVVDYTYDVEDPEAYGSQGNRLMSSVATSGGQTVEERWYAYNEVGNVEQVIRRIAGDEDPGGEQWYRGTQLYYSRNRLLWLARSDRWQLDAGGQPVNCEPLAAMEYRYDGPRMRYLVRPRDPASLVPYASDDGEWHDYDGDWISGDFTVAYTGGAVVATEVMAHEPGLAQFDQIAGDLHHLHGNLIGTTERMTDDSASIAHRAVYTAFGEPVWSDGTVGTRYGYAGAWGYQSAGSGDPLDDLGWLHVGERFYDPSSGRFVQRDPIGIRGGLNVYEYVNSNPAMLVDPSGLDWVEDLGDAGVVVAACGIVICYVPVPGARGVGVGVIAGGGIIKGVSSGIKLYRRHPGGPGMGPVRRGNCTRGCHNDNRPWRRGGPRGYGP